MCVTPHRQTRPIRPYLTAIWRLPWPSSRASMPVLSTLCLCLCLNLSPCQCWCQCQCLRLPISVSVSVLSRLGAIPPLRLKRMGVCLAFACVNSIGALGGRAVNHDVTPSAPCGSGCAPYFACVLAIGQAVSRPVPRCVHSPLPAAAGSHCLAEGQGSVESTFETVHPLTCVAVGRRKGTNQMSSRGR